VETSTGILLPNDYIKKIGKCLHEYGGLFVLDGIASGHLWIDIKELEVDI